MKKSFSIRDESGFGLIHVLALMLIVSLSLLGMFMSIEYARAQSNANYHTRRALLIAQGYIEEIKYDNRNLGTTSYPRVISRTENCTIDSWGYETLDGEVVISTTAGGIPNQVPGGYLNTYYDKVIVDVIWEENPIANLAHYMNPQRQVRIQEDYYWERSGVDVN